MNAVVKNTSSTALASINSLKQGIANVQQTMVRKSSDPYLRMLKDGVWVYGQEDLEVEPGSIWAANPLSIQHGWVAWNREKGADNSGGPLGEVMVSLNTPLPGKDTLKDVGADWDYQMAIAFMCLTGTDKGEQVLYKASSVGAAKAMDDLVKAIMRQLDADDTKPVPTVTFDNSSYNHKLYGKTYEPVIDINGWVELSDTAPEVEEPAAEQAAQAKTETAKPARARTRSVPATGNTTAGPQAPAGEEDELAAMERKIVEMKLAKEAKAKAAPAADATVAVDPVAARKAALMAEMAALDAEAAGTQAEQPKAQSEAPAGNAPMRRRRS